MQAHGRMPQEPWNYGERVLDLYRAYVLLHEQLVPYVRAAAATAARTGLPIIRPLCLIDPGDPRGWTITDAYGYGPALWVAPVLDEGAREREVALPRGEWIETWSGAARARRRRGGRRRRRSSRIPVWVRAGSIVVTYPADARRPRPRRRARVASGRWWRRCGARRGSGTPPCGSADGTRIAWRRGRWSVSPGAGRQLRFGQLTFVSLCASTSWRPMHDFVSLILVTVSVLFLSLNLYLPVPVHLPGPPVSVSEIVDFLIV